MSDSTDSDRIEETYKERRRNRTIDEIELDRSSGNGSGDYPDSHIDTIDESRVVDSNAATTFDSGDGDGILRSDGSRVDYQELFEHHVGRHPHSSGDEYRELEHDDRRTTLVQTLGNQLELTDHQIQRAMHFFEKIDFSRIGSLSEEEIALACAAMAANKDDWHIQLDDSYKGLRDDLGLEASDVRAARYVLREQVGYW